ncbi:MAG: hypothetical protein AB7L13_20385 [Acidimicrobiia bacterium]
MTTGRRLGTALAGGIVFAAAFRGWMRLASDDPSFTVAGTGYIVASITLATVVVEVAAGARRRWSRNAGRCAVAIFTVPLAMGAGVLFVPSLVAGAMAWNLRSTHRRRWTVSAALAALQPVKLFVGTFIGTGDTSWAKSTTLFVGYMLIVLIATKHYSRAWRARAAVADSTTGFAATGQAPMAASAASMSL